MEAPLHPLLQRRIAAAEVPGRAVIATEPDGRIVYWNREAEGLYGWTAAEAEGRNIVEITPTDLAIAEAEEIMDRLRRGRRWAGEFLVRAKDGSKFTVHVTDIPVTDEGGNLVGIVGVSRRSAYLQE